MSDFSPPSNSLLPSSSSRRRFLGAVSAAVAGTLGGCSAVYPAATTTISSDDWPLVGYDPAGSGYKPDGLSLRSKPDVRWKRTPQSVFGTPSSPLVYDGTVYTASGDLLAVDVSDGTTRTLFSELHGQFPAIAADTAYRNETVISTDGRRVSAVNPSPDLRGELRYRWRTPAPESSFASSFFPSNDGSPPVVADGLVFVPTHLDERSLLALDASSGAERWRYRTDGMASRASVHDGTVYVATWLNEFAALDAETGAVRWRRQPFKDVLTRGYVTAADHGVYGVRDDYAIAFEAESGDRRWSRHLDDDSEYAEIQGTPTVTDDAVFVQVEREKGMVLLALDPQSGQTRWSAPVGGHETTPAIAGETVYAPDQSGLVALDAKTGRRLWTFPTKGDPSPPAVGGGALLFTDGFALYALEASR